MSLKISHFPVFLSCSQIAQLPHQINVPHIKDRNCIEPFVSFKGCSSIIEWIVFVLSLWLNIYLNCCVHSKDHILGIMITLFHQEISDVAEPYPQGPWTTIWCWSYFHWKKEIKHYYFDMLAKLRHEYTTQKSRNYLNENCWGLNFEGVDFDIWIFF